MGMLVLVLCMVGGDRYIGGIFVAWLHWLVWYA